MELRASAATLAVLGAVGGCGDGGGAGRPDAREDEAAVEKVLDDALDALFEGDGPRACSHYTSSYRRKLVRENQADTSDVAPKGASCEEQVRDYQPILMRFVPGRDVKVIEVRVRGDRATAVSRFKTTRGKTRVTEFLVRRDGEWKINDDQEPGERPPPSS